LRHAAGEPCRHPAAVQRQIGAARASCHPGPSSIRRLSRLYQEIGWFAGNGEPLRLTSGAKLRGARRRSSATFG
jgi:hypothetical protein